MKKKIEDKENANITEGEANRINGPEKNPPSRVKNQNNRYGQELGNHVRDTKVQITFLSPKFKTFVLDNERNICNQVRKNQTNCGVRKNLIIPVGYSKTAALNLSNCYFTM